ncbi:gp32 [Lomovskayavirus C31]|uniref:Gp32 n=1 Tax=Streptomyces phage phiC31 TaxID=10719 RepID=Q37837_BPPHC|nr:gp32 [Lomovskayavirus C31]CAA07102.1 gp32 [Lomovskayavirus C31]CAA62590.1 ORF6 [Lomovskayavirus C31]
MNANATPTRYFGKTNGLHYVRVVLRGEELYRTPGYYTLDMAVADAACWEAFRVVAPAETPAEKRDRMKRDEAAGVDKPVEGLREGDYVWHTYTMKAAYNRKGQRVSDEYQVSEWVECSGAWARDWARGLYGYRLVGFTFGAYANKGETVKVHRDPKALKRAEAEATRAVYAAFSKR